MIPILYRADETAFTSNGLGRLIDCVSCEVTEERNGIYECAFQYPLTGRFYQEMHDNGGIVGVIHDDAHDIQPFEIYKFSAPIDGIVTFYAHHISYRLSNVIVKPFTAATCAEALLKLKSESATPNPFTFWTDKGTSGTFTVKTPSALRALLGGQQGSILDVYGKGDYKFDKWEVRLYNNRGTDTGVTIRYGKNLADIEHERDESGTFSAVAPYWMKEDVVVTLPEIYVVSPSVAADVLPWTIQTGEIMQDGRGNDIDFNVPNIVVSPLDLSGSFEDEPTADQLREAALAYMANNEPWIPDENVKVDFAALWQTPEYENVAALQRVSLCDTVSVFYPELGVIQDKQKVIRVVYDVLAERYSSIELGRLRTTLAEAIAQPLQEDMAKELAEKPSQSDLEAAIDYATRLITGGLGGYVVMTPSADGYPQEILIMDTPDVNTAVNVWRWNKNGLGHSHSGYSGPYSDVAITMDGAINANLITTGALNANLITTGALNAALADVINLNASNISTGTLSADRIAAHSLGVGKITGSLSGGLSNSWGIDFKSGTLTIGNISAANITTGTLSANRIAANSIAVSKLTGSISNGDWKIDLDAGTFSIGTITAEHIDTKDLRVSAANITGVLTIGQLPSDVATDSDIPTKVSELTNDSGFQTATQVTTITNNTISTTNVLARNLQVKAANISGLLKASQIEVGNGSNLFPNYDSFEQVTNSTLYYAKSSTLTAEILTISYAREGANVMSLSTGTNATNAYVFIGHSSNNYGQVRCSTGRYVFSFYARNTTGQSVLNCQVFGRKTMGSSWSDSTVYTRIAQTDVTITGGYVRGEIPFEVTSTYPFICVRFQLKTASRTIYVDCLQLEQVDSADQGAGAWHPAGTTIINGGNITAGTITADAIAAHSITVSKLSGSISRDDWEIDFDNGVLTIGKISADNITAGTINAENITVTNINGTNIKDGTIGSNPLASGAVTGGSDGKIASDTITTFNTGSGINTNLGWGASYGAAVNGTSYADDYYVTNLRATRVYANTYLYAASFQYGSTMLSLKTKTISGVTINYLGY